MKKLIILGFVLLFLGFYGCGYTTRAYVGPYKTIYIAPFKNSINIASEKATYSNYLTYYPLLESAITQAVVDRFILDGSLKVVKESDADVVLKGELISYDRNPLRYAANNEDATEYRITLTVNMGFYRGKDGTEISKKNGFSGDTSYFITGSQAKSEKAALDDAIKDLARRIVEDFVEVW
ncbi:MAG: LptE family protein [Candidatus Omnitrophica bacterium]|nr:LptE family protein [Candidatus Omnitrophota bacterium]MDD5351745.1 LptE family protein [Candidatus Omnitrophota bacterium]MDD5550956.1 LptE family protein [Candidatus Omnitrophota bacterium]